MKIARIIGWILIAIGVLGFIPGITTSDGMFLGVFGVDAVHNLVHLITGILLVALAGNKGLVIVLAIIYLLLGIIGLFSGGDVLGFLTANAADDWLHIVLGLLLLWGGMKMGKTSAAAM